MMAFLSWPQYVKHAGYIDRYLTTQHKSCTHFLGYVNLSLSSITDEWDDYIFVHILKKAIIAVTYNYNFKTGRVKTISIELQSTWLV